MSTQVTNPKAVQFIYDSFIGLIYNGTLTAHKQDVERKLERFSIPNSKKHLDFTSDKLAYMLRVLQVYNIKAYNNRYSFCSFSNDKRPDKLDKSERVKWQTVRTEPSKKDLLQALKLLQHLDYNLDDYSVELESVISIIDCLQSAIKDYLVFTMAGYEDAGWGYIK